MVPPATDRFGNHPAYLVLRHDGHAPFLTPELVVPGDVNDARTAYGIAEVTVGVESPPPTTPAHPGDLKIDAGIFTGVLTGARLAAVPARTVVGSDGYPATVTPAEARVGGRPLPISTN